MRATDVLTDRLEILKCLYVVGIRLVYLYRHNIYDRQVSGIGEVKGEGGGYDLLIDVHRTM